MVNIISWQPTIILKLRAINLGLGLFEDRSLHASYMYISFPSVRMKMNYLWLIQRLQSKEKTAPSLNLIKSYHNIVYPESILPYINCDAFQYFHLTCKEDAKLC